MYIYPNFWGAKFIIGRTVCMKRVYTFVSRLQILSFYEILSNFYQFSVLTLPLQSASSTFFKYSALFCNQETKTKSISVIKILKRRLEIKCKIMTV